MQNLVHDNKKEFKNKINTHYYNGKHNRTKHSIHGTESTFKLSNAITVLFTPLPLTPNPIELRAYT